MSEKVLVYKEIYNNLREHIFSGEFPPGYPLPSEYTLCDLFSASRETVRKSLHLLEAEGLIYAKQKVGYFVSAPNHSDFTLHFTEEKDGTVTSFKEVHGIRPPADIRKALGLEEGRVAIEFIQLTRDRNGQPVAYDAKYIPYERATPAVESEMRFTLMDPDLSFAPSFNYYSTIEVSSAAAPEKVAEALGLEAGAPLLLVERRFIRQDGTIIGYSRQYSTKAFGRLYGIAGPRNSMEVQE